MEVDGYTIVKMTKKEDYLKIEHKWRDLCYHYEEVNGQNIYGFNITWYNYVKFVVNNDSVTMYHDKIFNILGSLFVGNNRIKLTDSDDDFYSIIDKVGGSIIPYKNKIRIDKGQFDRAKISQDHHTLLRPEEILETIGYSSIKYNMINKDKIDSIEIIRDNVDNNYLNRDIIALMEQFDRLGINNETTISTFFLYFSVSNKFCRNIILAIIYISENFDDFVSALKTEGRLSKQSQHIYRHDLNKIFEINVLINRTVEELDWDKEIKNRTVDMKVVNLDRNIVYNRALFIFKQAAVEGKIPRYSNWENYWKQRWAIMPTGTYVSQYDDDNEVKRLIKNHGLKNKTVIMSSIKSKNFKEYYNRIPSIFASTSIKYEWGKSRAVYGCDITSFLMSDFSMRDCESCLPGYFPVGEQSSEEKVKKKVRLLSNTIPLCYDYDDFNSQHSKQSMKEVIRAWHKVFGIWLSDEQKQSCLWTEHSINKLLFRINNKDKNIYEAEGTLYSGWRLTSFVNSVLNRIYLEEAGLLDNCLYALHNGDDVLAALDNFNKGLKLIENAEKIGLRANKTKMNLGTIGEFLRIDGLAKDATAAQYLTRACSTAVHSRIEAEAATNIEACMDATNDRMMSIIKRGGNMDITRKIENRTIKRYCNIFDTEEDVANRYFYTHNLQGGCNNEGGILNIRLQRKLISRTEDENDLNVVDMMEPGTQDYINYLATEYNINLKNVDRAKIRSANREMAGIDRYKLISTKEERKNINYLRGIYKSYKNNKLNVSLSKARLLGLFNINLTGKVSKYLLMSIRASSNPLEMLNILV